MTVLEFPQIPKCIHCGGPPWLGGYWYSRDKGPNGEILIVHAKCEEQHEAETGA